MTTETEYQNAVNYLTKLLNGGLMGERGSKPLRIAIEACELQIPKQPISKSWSPNLCPHCDADLGGDCNDGYYQNPHYERCPCLRTKTQIHLTGREQSFPGNHYPAQAPMLPVHDFFYIARRLSWSFRSQRPRCQRGYECHR